MKGALLNKLIAGILIIGGVLVMLGWVFGVDALVQPLKHHAPMQFNAAFCFVLTGVLLLTMDLVRSKVKIILGILMLLISGLTAVEYFFNCMFNVDELLIDHYIKDETVSPGRMGINTIVGFFSIGLFMIYTFYKEILVKNILGLFVLTLGFVSVCGYFFGNHLAYKWPGFTGMSISTAIAFVLTGLSMSMHSFRVKETTKNEYFILGITIGLCCLFLDFAFPQRVGGIVYLLLIIYSWYGNSKQTIFIYCTFGLVLNCIGLIFKLVSISSWEIILYNRLGSSVLIIAISYLLIRIREKENSVNESKRFFESIFQYSSDALIIFEASGKVIKVNGAIKKIFNIEIDYLLNKNLLNFIVPVKKDFFMNKNEVNFSNINRLLSINKNKIRLKFFGKEQYVHASIYPLNIVDKIYYSLVLTDITFAESQAVQLNQQRRELIEVNKELKDFVYTVCHDLEEPIRTVKAFSNFSMNQFKNEIPEKLNNHLLFINGAADRMEGLIDDLTNYSNIGVKRKLKHCDLNQIITNSIADLQLLISENNIQVEVAENLPYASIFENEFRLVFQNLIHNAIKFRPKNKVLKIEIGFDELPNKYLFFVKDNGKGIHPDFHQKIFKVFKRLVSKEESKGSGLGLAICKKVISFHKGDIWVESHLNEGAKFIFTIAKEEMQYEN